MYPKIIILYWWLVLTYCIYVLVLELMGTAYKERKQFKIDKILFSKKEKKKKVILMEIKYT